MEYLIYKSFNNINKDEILSKAAEIAVRYNISGKLHKIYAAFMIINDENIFSLLCEKNDMPGGSISSLARADLSKFIGEMSKIADVEFAAPGDEKTVFGCAVEELILDLSKLSPEAAAAGIYKKYGVGTFGFNKAFYLDESGKIKPSGKVSDVTFDELYGYEIQKEQLIKNTEKFISGKTANNVLLFGDGGTGKSTCVKALLNRFYDDGLRIIEISKHQFKYLRDVSNAVRDRNYHFIIYMDDLSFEDFEIEYKYLKAIIEGGLEPTPDNVLIYATSNRRHLVKESWKDRDDFDTEIHRSDTMQEKLSLAERFGLAINFTKPGQKEYYGIVLHLAKREGIEMSEEELLAGARRWELKRGGMSGRAARQYINHILEKKRKDI